MYLIFYCIDNSLLNFLYYTDMERQELPLRKMYKKCGCGDLQRRGSARSGRKEAPGPGFSAVLLPHFHGKKAKAGASHSVWKFLSPYSASWREPARPAAGIWSGRRETLLWRGVRSCNLHIRREASAPRAGVPVPAGPVRKSCCRESGRENAPFPAASEQGGSRFGRG